MAIKIRIGGNYTLNETILDSDMSPILHMGERVVITEFHQLSGWFIVKNKIGETMAVHSTKLDSARGRPMRVIG
jgi:hypothetical protein